MSAAFPAPTPLHRAALVLHGLGREDAAWMLESLSAEQRGVLAPLLLELEALAIPRDASLVGQAAAHGAPQEGRAYPGLHALDPLAVDRLAALLAAEPPRLAGLLLGAERWPWQQRVRHLLRLPLGADPVPVAPALHDALLAATQRALRAEGAQQIPPPATAWRRLATRLSPSRRRS